MGKSDHSLYNVIWAYSNYVIKKIYVYAYQYMYATTINKKAGHDFERKSGVHGRIWKAKVKDRNGIIIL